MGEKQDTRMPLTSQDVVAERIESLRELFPEVFTEGAIDFAKLKQALGEFTDDSPERYGLSWAGKSEAIRAVQPLSSGTLVPCKEESVNFDTTENLIIEGDNLEVLKLLQKSYYGKVKMIYIDPPYNTGHEFIYPDNYREGLDGYLRYSGQVSDDGVKLETNTETNGRFHSKWLNMMYPRLFLARNLLRDDGLIFISIDDNEIGSLRFVCDEIFGMENFKGQITRPTGTPTGQGTDQLVNEQDYMLVYSRSPECLILGLPLTKQDEKIYDQEDERGRYLIRPLRKTGGEDRRKDRPSMYFPVPDPDGNLVYPIGPGGYESRWRCGPSTYEEHLANGLIEWRLAREDGIGKWKPYQKFYLEGHAKQPGNLWNGIEGNKKASRDLRELFGDKVFDNPKPVEMIKRCCQIGTTEDSLILDFFAGSGTTAHTVLDMNKADGGTRKFILVQLPEPVENQSLPSIADICKERVRRIIKKLNDQDNGKLDLDNSTKQDRGFKVFKLTSSNFKLWNADEAPKDAEALAEQLRLYADHIMPGRSQDDILYELLLKAGLPLTAKIEEKQVNGQKVFSVADGTLLICLEDEITHETLRGMMELKPETVLCLDNAFKGNDQLKTNIVLEMESHEIKFHTV